MGKKNKHLDDIKNSFDNIHISLSNLMNSGGDEKIIPYRSLSGDHIYGGKIVNFSSTGITDSSNQTSLFVTERGISTKSIVAESIDNDITVNGNLTVTEQIRAKKLHVDELTSDVRISRSKPLEFEKEKNKNSYNLGLYWLNENVTHQLVLRPEPDRLWSSLSIDLKDGQDYKIDGVTVIGSGALGQSIRKSNLTKVGVLQNLETGGNLNIDNFVFYETISNRIGIGTETPNATLCVKKHNTEFIIDPENEKTKFGNWTTSDLDIITDDTSRIHISGSGKITFGKENPTTVSVNGKLGINVKNPDADLCLAESMKIAGKKHTVASEKPTNGSHAQGDIVWNSSPNPTGYVGWICVRSGSPGEWKAFGAIAR